MKERLKSENALVFSYLTLRKAIGVLGTLFPFVLYLGAVIIFQTGMKNSISSYYHTGMRDVFVGTLCVIGFFLLSYKGYNRADDVAGDLCCIFAVGTALFPVAPDNPASGDARFIGYIHFAFAALFFLTLIYFSLFLFTKTDQSRPATRKKLQRNKVYKVCGYTMSICIVLIGIYFLLPDEVRSPIEIYNLVFWLEAIAVVAFGISWLTKGDTISWLRDRQIKR
jgi:hypothetical protein